MIARTCRGRIFSTANTGIPQNVFTGQALLRDEKLTKLQTLLTMIGGKHWAGSVSQHTVRVGLVRALSSVEGDMDPGSIYKIKQPTLAIRRVEKSGAGKPAPDYLSVSITSGAVVKVIKAGEKFVTIEWDGQEASMFVEDLKARADRVEPGEA